METLKCADRDRPHSINNAKSEFQFTVQHSKQIKLSKPGQPADSQKSLVVRWTIVVAILTVLQINRTLTTLLGLFFHL